MNILQQVENESLRRDVLALLNEDGDYETSNINLINALKQLGINFSMDRFLNQFLWLQEQSLITITAIAHTELTNIKITQRGIDVANKAVVITGIARTPV